MKKATAITFFNDSVGKRMSMVYSEIDEKTAKIVSDNKRTDIVVTDKCRTTLTRSRDEYGCKRI